MTRRVTHHTHSPDSTPLQNPNVDTATRSEANGRVVIGGVSCPPDLPAAVRDVVISAAIARQSRADKREQRKAKKRDRREIGIGEFVEREARREERARKRQDELEAAYAAYRYPRQPGQPKPTERQALLVERDINRRERENLMQGASEEERNAPPPWIAARKYGEERWRRGFRGKAGDPVGDRYEVQADFSEKGLRSRLSPALMLHVRGHNKGGPAAGREREDRFTAGRFKAEREIYYSRLEGFDQIYTRGNAKFRHFFRHENDSIWPSEAHLRALFERAVEAGKIPCLPHIMTCHQVDAEGRVYRPQFYWELPPGSEVYYNPFDRKCRRKPMKLYNGVVAGSWAAVDEICGADAGALANPIDGKNPVAPQSYTWVWNETAFPTLDQWRRFVNVHLKAHELLRAQAIDLGVKSGLSDKQSNKKFSEGGELAFPLLRDAYKSKDESLLACAGDTDLVIEWLTARLCQALGQHEEVFRKCASWAAHHWNPDRIDHRHRGKAFHLVRDIEIRDDAGRLDRAAVHARQSIGVTFSNAERRAKTVGAIAEAIDELRIRPRPDGTLHPADLKSVATAVGKTEQTVRIRLREALEHPMLTVNTLNDQENQIQCLMPGKPLDRQINNQLLPSCSQSTDQIEPSTTPPPVTIWPGGYAFGPQATVKLSDNESVMFGDDLIVQSASQKTKKPTKAKKHVPQKRSGQKSTLETLNKEVMVSERISNSGDVPAQPSGDSRKSADQNIEHGFPTSKRIDDWIEATTTVEELRKWCDLQLAGSQATVTAKPKLTKKR